MRAASGWNLALALHDHASGAGDDALRGKALTTAGWLAANERDYAAAEVLFQHSLALAYRTEEPQQIIAVLGDLGQAARMQGDLDRATALYKEALALSREIGDTRGVAWTLCNLGIIAHAKDMMVRLPHCWRKALPFPKRWATTSARRGA